MVCTPERPIDWKTFMKLTEINAKQVKSPLQIWYSTFKLRESLLMHKIAVIFLHYLPAYIVDFAARCLGKKPMLVQAYKKIGKFIEVISYFSTRQWDFRNNNTQALWKKLKEEDKDIFEFSMSRFSWDIFFLTYMKGARVYLLKDPLDTIPAGKIRYRKLQIAHYTLVTFLIFLLYLFLMLLYRLFV